MENISAVAAQDGRAAPSFERPPSNFPGVFGHGVSPGEIQCELERILDSKDFPASERNRRTLQYIVRCALEGRAAEISAYAIATRVYGRPKTFNSCKDPIVRIEVARLRRDLELYYLKSGARNPLRLSVPKGGYLPWVARHGGLESSREPAPSSPFLVSVLRAALLAWSGAQREASAAWQDLLLAEPSLLADLHGTVLREIGNEEVTRLIVEGVLHSARQTA